MLINAGGGIAFAVVYQATIHCASGHGVKFKIPNWVVRCGEDRRGKHLHRVACRPCCGVACRVRGKDVGISGQECNPHAKLVVAQRAIGGLGCGQVARGVAHLKVGKAGLAGEGAVRSAKAGDASRAGGAGVVRR